MWPIGEDILAGALVDVRKAGVDGEQLIFESAERRNHLGTQRGAVRNPARAPIIRGVNTESRSCQFVLLFWHIHSGRA